MRLEKKRRILFALLMGIITTGIISFVLLAINLGFTHGFAASWLQAWGIAYVVVIPTILVIGPILQSAINRFTDS